MKRWLLSLLALAVIAASILVVLARLRSAPLRPAELAATSHLIRVPNSASKYHLCAEAFAYKLAAPDNPYKTNETFTDPFRHTNDTIIPRFLGYESDGDTVSFSVELIFGQVATYNEKILHVHNLDGISILVPDRHNRLQHTSVPQFIISSLPLDDGNGGGGIAVLDFTCPTQWVWS
jgi:hypothetical protein